MPTADAPSLNTTVELAPLARLATISPSSIDQEARTVECVFSTGAPVRRFDWRTGEYFLEKLSLKSSHVRLQRLNSGAPLLDSHTGYSITNQFGVVEEGSARVADDLGIARLRFSKRPQVEGAWTDVRDRIVRSVSVGYMVHRYEEAAAKDNKLAVRTAVDWEPFEISLCSMPADTGAQIRDGKSAVLMHTAMVVSEQTVNADADRFRQLRLARFRSRGCTFPGHAGS